MSQIVSKARHSILEIFIIFDADKNNALKWKNKTNFNDKKVLWRLEKLTIADKMAFKKNMYRNFDVSLRKESLLKKM